jgi:SPP1 family predicted phage head-tail adaptor
MSIGQRKRVTLSQVLVTQDAAGRNVQSDGEHFKAWAEVSNPSGFRDYVNGHTQMGKSKRFMIRFRFDRYPNADWKIVYEGKQWTVSEITRVDEKNFYWQLTASSKSDV